MATVMAQYKDLDDEPWRCGRSRARKAWSARPLPLPILKGDHSNDNLSRYVSVTLRGRAIHCPLRASSQERLTLRPGVRLEMAHAARPPLFSSSIVARTSRKNVRSFSASALALAEYAPCLQLARAADPPCMRHRVYPPSGFRMPGAWHRVPRRVRAPQRGLLVKSPGGFPCCNQPRFARNFVTSFLPFRN